MTSHHSDQMSQKTEVFECDLKINIFVFLVWSCLIITENKVKIWQPITSKSKGHSVSDMVTCWAFSDRQYCGLIIHNAIIFQSVSPTLLLLLQSIHFQTLSGQLKILRQTLRSQILLIHGIKWKGTQAGLTWFYFLNTQSLTLTDIMIWATCKDAIAIDIAFKKWDNCLQWKSVWK